MSRNNKAGLHLYIVIPTYGRDSLLHRTLTSLAECRLPPELVWVLVVENGPKYEAESIVGNFEGKLPIQYLYSSKPNKSSALNHALNYIDDGVILFFDDDVRFNPDTIMAYLKAAGDSGGNCYWGGPLGIDYETGPPEEWLMEFLPNSVTGWSLKEAEKPSWFLGANWAVRAHDLHRLGGFDENYGPGSTSGARGQETAMQVRLKQAGLVPRYVPDALVYHYVPQENCSPDWLLNRRFQIGKYSGINHSAKSFWKKAPIFVYAHLASLLNYILVLIYNFLKNRKKSFHYRLVFKTYRGMLSTFRIF